MKRLVVGTLLLLLAAVVAAAIFFWRAPVEATALTGRVALRWAGLARAAVDTARGPIVYFRGGTGPVLIFLHGANDQAGTWARVAPAFVSRHHVVVADLAGHGDSAPASGTLTLADLVDGVRAVVAAERGPGRVVLIGNSLGAFLALVHASRHPDEVAAVVAVNGAIMRGGNAEAARLLLPRTREEARTVMDLLTSPRSPRVPAFVLDDLVRRAPTSPLARLLAEPPETVEAWLLDDRLSEIATPVTLVWGADDRLIPLEYAEQARARLRQARLEVIPDCGHVPQRECAPALVAVLQRVLPSLAP